MLNYRPSRGSGGPIFNMPTRKFVKRLWLFIGFLVGVHLIDMVIGGTLVEMFGIVPRDVSAIWNIVTSWAVHGSFLHVMLNALFILMFGMYLEHFAKVFWPLTILGAIVSGIVIWAFGTEGSLHVGASGIGFAYMGFLAVLPHWCKGGLAKQMRYSARFLIVVNLFITFLLPGISIAGHLGGLIIGSFLGLYYAKQYAGRTI